VVVARLSEYMVLEKYCGFSGFALQNVCGLENEHKITCYEL
jgi:hypothetical protein